MKTTLLAVHPRQPRVTQLYTLLASHAIFLPRGRILCILYPEMSIWKIGSRANICYQVGNGDRDVEIPRMSVAREAGGRTQETV